MATAAFILAILATVFEGILAIPVVGWFLVAGSGGLITLFIMFVLHGAVLTLRILDGEGDKVAPILGLVASLLAIIPVVGFVLHVITFIFYIIGFAKQSGRNSVA